jgi:hypothetical protein
MLAPGESNEVEKRDLDGLPGPAYFANGLCCGFELERVADLQSLSGTERKNIATLTMMATGYCIKSFLARTSFKKTRTLEPGERQRANGTTVCAAKQH